MIFIMNREQIVVNPALGLWWLRFPCVFLPIGLLLLRADRARCSLHLCFKPKPCRADRAGSALILSCAHEDGKGKQV